MERPLRGDKSPVPKRLKKYLNECQLRALDSIEKFGWTIAFVRRPIYQPATVFMINRVGKRYGILREDGILDQDIPMDIREETVSVAQGKPVKKNPKPKVLKNNDKGKRKTSVNSPIKARA